MPCQSPSLTLFAARTASNFIPISRLLGTRAGVPVRSATEEEENWLNTQERLECEAQMQRLAEIHDPLEEMIADAQAFEEEVRLPAEEQEAEDIEEHEVAYLHALSTFGEVHEMEQRRQDLMWSSEAVSNPATFENLSIPQLLATQQSLFQANRMIHESLSKSLSNGLMEASLENRKLRQQLESAKALFEVRSVVAAAELEEARRRATKLEEKLEAADSRITCRICFDKPRNVLAMPCLHFEYCHRCLKEHKKRSNTCPTCRTPLAGVLKCELNVD